MTEQTVELDAVSQKFILHWGEMGTRWGVNRTVAQIHALLFLADRPLHAEEIAETLAIARSNVSTSLRELQSWNLSHVTHVFGDRRDHYTTFKDMHDICRAVIEGKKRREIDPALTVLRDCVLAADETTPAVVKAKVTHALEFMEMLDGWYDDMKKLESGSWIELIKMGTKVQGFLKRGT
jgi:DNA-binding transcriptional regulator GbsR (MarR family)